MENNERINSEKYIDDITALEDGHVIQQAVGSLYSHVGGCNSNFLTILSECY